MITTAVDNDVVYKGLCYGLLAEICESAGQSGGVGVLGTARFVVGKNIQRANLRADNLAVLRRLTSFLERAETLEPTDAEMDLAADFEAAAQRRTVALDTGESQLCAIVVERTLPRLLTGDKRAIAAIEALLDELPKLANACGRVKCLEQVVDTLLADGRWEGVRAAVCAEPAVDRTLDICFSCQNVALTVNDTVVALRSYVDDLRAQAPHVLAP